MEEKKINEVKPRQPSADNTIWGRTVLLQADDDEVTLQITVPLAAFNKLGLNVLGNQCRIKFLQK